MKISLLEEVDHIDDFKYGGHCIFPIDNRGSIFSNMTKGGLTIYMSLFS